MDQNAKLPEIHSLPTPIPPTCQPTPLHVPNTSHTRHHSLSSSLPIVALVLLASPLAKNQPPNLIHTIPPPFSFMKAAMYHRSVDVAKAHEIMAKFRPIAPKPALPTPAEASARPSATAAAFCLRARPCRARKRGRTGLVPVPNKRQRTATFLPVLPNNSPQLAQFRLPSAPGFARGLSLLPENPNALALSIPSGEREVTSPPVEQDLLKKLQEPRVITPQPVRPVGSSISVGCITEAFASKNPVSKQPEEVEEEVESEALPAVVSDSKNRVRLANSAYKEMVGQPECPWLDSMVSNSGGLGLKTRARVSSRRINGEVMLELKESSEIPAAAEGFSCRVKIEWACNGRKSFVDAPCDVIRLYCDSKDYMFTWRIHTAEAFETNCKA